LSGTKKLLEELRGRRQVAEAAAGDREGPDGRARRRTDGAEERAVYIISVAAELAGVHPQTLRMYERRGLLAPKRTSGNTRRYSDRDIALLRQIQDLTQESGINLAGVKMIIEMQAELEALRQAAELEAQLEAADREPREIVPLRSMFLPPWQGGVRP
jgi:MerR family transcriptional regulator/heat shock protein HspR